MTTPLVDDLSIPELPLEELPAPEPAELTFVFHDVAVKNDGSFVVTLDGNRCHVTPDYNAQLYSAVQSYLDQGSSFTDYAEDILVEADPAVLAKVWIDASLAASESLVSEYRDARDLGDELPIAAEQFTQLLTWRRAVREWTQTTGYPSEASRPVAPNWMETVSTDGQ